MSAHAAQWLAALRELSAEEVEEARGILGVTPDEQAVDDPWMDTKGAASYLGMHPDTLGKLAAARAIPYEQDAPGCKRWFRRSDLDRWRANGGRPSHLRVVAQR